VKILFAFPIVAALVVQAPATPQQAVDELLAADRAFSSAGSSQANVIDALTPMFAPDVIMPQPGGKFTHGVDEAVTALKANADNTTAKAEWTPVRGGISADGTQGFTFGYMTLHKPDGSSVPLKYMSYWMKTASGWKVAVYKRSRRPEGDVSTALMPPSLPDKLVAPKPSALAAAAAEVAAAEKSFSDESQTMGLGAAFAKYGAADAVNMGGQPSYVVGNDKIAASVGGPSLTTPSPLHWAADEKVIAASSGDLGISVGIIHRNAPQPDGSTPTSAFFTIWRKTNGVWKYIA
jgi:ketosteroid isomerase-like protein